MKQTILSLSIVSSLLFASCQKENGPANGESTITYKLATRADAGGTSPSVERLASSFLEITGGTAAVSEIKFEAKGDDKIEYKSNADRIIDLSQAVSTIGNLSVPYGTYDKIEFKIQFEPHSGQPAFVLHGNYLPSAGGAAIPVVVEFRDAFELKFEKKTATTIDASTDYTALGILAFETLSQSIPESVFTGAALTNGQIIISSNSNTQLYNPLWSVFQELLKVEIKED